MSTAELMQQLRGGSSRDEEPLVTDSFDQTAPTNIEQEALYGLAGEIVKTFEPHTEGDPAALLVQFVVAFGNLIGRNAHIRIGASKHFCNLFAAMIGNSSTGRKGTSWDCIALLLQRVDEDWWNESRIFGLGSGEGLVAAVRDPEPLGLDEKSKPHSSIPKPKDKRGMVIEGEFASVLKVFQREGSTLSPTVRNAWDSGDLRVTTKKDSLKSTGAHISIIGHCTATELSLLLSATDMFNGVGNRFIWVSSKRSKLLPMPGLPDQEDIDSLIEKISSAAQFAKAQSEIKLSAAAEKAYRSIYEDLVRDKPGLLGVLTARAAPNVLRLSAIYALLDQTNEIQPKHLTAALAVWEYAEKSVKFIFGNSTGDRMADKLLIALKEAPAGLTQTEILEKVFSGNIKATRVASALRVLKSFELAHPKEEKSETGRRVIRWLFTRTSQEFYESRPENSSNSYLVRQKREEVVHVSR